MKIIFLDYDGVVNNLVFRRPTGNQLIVVMILKI